MEYYLELKARDIHVYHVKQDENWLDRGGADEYGDYWQTRQYYGIPWLTYEDFNKHCPLGKIWHKETKAGRTFIGGC